MLSQQESQWLEFPGSCGIKKMSLIGGKVRVLGDALSRALHIIANNTGTPSSAQSVIQLAPSDMTTANYDTDQCFAPFARALCKNQPAEEIQRDLVNRLPRDVL